MPDGAVLLVVPPGLPGTTPNREGAAGLGAVGTAGDRFRYPPHTIAAVASATAEAGLPLAVLDAVAEGMTLADVLAHIRAERPGVIGVFVSWATREADAALVTTLKRDAGGLADIPVVAFGPSVAHMTEPLIAADHVLEGEPERAFPVAARRLLAGRALSWVLTPHSLGVDGYNDKGLLTDLDALSYPAWARLPLRNVPYLTVLSSRGCAGTCRWCPYVVAQGRAFRACSAERVVDELAHLVKTYAPRRIVFRDPAFAHDRARVEAICEGILRHRRLDPGRNLLWECESRPEHLDAALLRRMSLAGCVGVKVGLETLDAGLLTDLGRLLPGWDAGRYRGHLAILVRACRAYDIAPRLYAIAGLPGQTLAMVEEVGRLAQQLRVVVEAQPLRRYPGHTLEEVAHMSVPDEEEATAQMERLRQMLAYRLSHPRGLARAQSLVWRGWRKLRRRLTVGVR